MTEQDKLEILIRDILLNGAYLEPDKAWMAANDIMNKLTVEHAIERKPYIETTRSVA